MAPSLTATDTETKNTGKTAQNRRPRLSLTPGVTARSEKRATRRTRQKPRWGENTNATQTFVSSRYVTPSPRAWAVRPVAGERKSRRRWNRPDQSSRATSRAGRARPARVSHFRLNDQHHLEVCLGAPSGMLTCSTPSFPVRSVTRKVCTIASPSLEWARSTPSCHYILRCRLPCRPVRFGQLFFPLRYCKSDSQLLEGGHVGERFGGGKQP